MFTKLSMLLIFLTVCVSIIPSNGNLEVQISEGILRGSYYTTTKNKTYIGFTGIPFATPPVGELRFKEPFPSKPWQGILDATKGHTICPQKNRQTNEVDGNEDCLYLNVYTPNLDRKKRSLLPVMFFIHGGGFTIGSGDRSFYGSNIFLNENIVLVTINYRLGALGYVSTGDEVVPGNNGLKDQSLALKWVKKHIDAFGGDPNNISIMGQSSGGASAHLHYFSPLSKNLFQRVIALSGTAFMYWSLSPNSRVLNNTKELAELFSCSTSDNKEMIRCLRSIKAESIVKVQSKMGVVWASHPVFPFRPVIEPKLPGAFLSEHPEDIFKAGNASDVPLMTGVTTEDGKYASLQYLENQEEWMNDINFKFNEVMPIIMDYSNHNNKDDVSSQFREHYFGNKTISRVTDLTTMFTDTVFAYGADKAVKMHLKYSNQPVYYYVFGYRGTQSFSKLFGYTEDDTGVQHADELIYLFTLDKWFPNHTLNLEETKVSDLITRLMSNFMEFNNPSPVNDVLVPYTWDSVTTKNVEYFFIKPPLEIQMETGFHRQGIDFVENLNIFSTSQLFKGSL